MANTSTLTVKIIGNASDAISEIGRLDGALGKLGKGALIAGGALGTAGLAAGGALFAIGQSFDDIENTIIKGTGATGAALDDLTQQAKDVLEVVPDGGGVVAAALADVNTYFGQTGDTLEESTRLFLEFARVTDADLTTAIGSLDAAFTQFGESPDNLNDALGDFTRISQATGAPIDKLLGQMETFGPIFANAGFSIEETTAIFGQLEQAGVDVTRVGPALNKFFRDAAEAGEDPREALNGVVSSIENASSAADALNIATDAFGAEGAQRMTNAIRSGNFDLKDFNDLLGDGRGLVSEQAEATKSFGDQLNQLKNRVFVALAPAAEIVFAAVGDAIEDLGPYIDKFGVWFAEKLPGWIETVRAVIEKWAPVVIAAVKGFVDFMVDSWPFVQAVIEAVVDAVVFALEEVLIPTALFLLDNVFQPIYDWTVENWPTIESIIVGVLEVIGETFQFFIDTTLGFWNVFGDEIMSVVEIAWTFVSTYIDGAFTVITGVFNTFKGLFTGDWDLMWAGIQGVFEGYWTIVSAVIEGAFDLLKLAIEGILDATVAIITGTWDSVVEEVSGLGSRIADAAVGIFDGVKDAFVDAINFIIDGWNGLSFTLPSIDLGPFGSVGGFTISTPNIPRLADGGLAYSEMLAIVGDNPNAFKDPEVIAPQSTIRATIDEALTDMFGTGGATGSLTINANGYTDTQALVRDVDEGLRRRDALAGRYSLAGDLEAA